MAKESIKIGEHLSGTIAKEKRPLIVEDIKRDQRYIARDMAKRLGYVSFLGVPMMIHNEVKGVICVYTKEPRKFTEKDIELLTSFADMAAVALEKAKLFEDLEKAKEKIEESEKNLKNFSGKILSIREDEKNYVLDLAIPGIEKAGKQPARRVWLNGICYKLSIKYC